VGERCLAAQFAAMSARTRTESKVGTRGTQDPVVARRFPLVTYAVNTKKQVEQLSFLGGSRGLGRRKVGPAAMGRPAWICFRVGPAPSPLTPLPVGALVSTQFIFS
jgi:hypothetical protein